MDQTAYFEQMRKRRRAEILEQAKEMLIKDGIYEFTMQKLAATLDISTVTLYKYFKNIDDLIIAILNETIQYHFFKNDEEKIDNEIECIIKYYQIIGEECLNKIGELNFVFSLKQEMQSIFILKEEEILYDIFIPLIESGIRSDCICRKYSKEKIIEYIIHTALSMIRHVSTTEYKQKHSVVEMKHWIDITAQAMKLFLKDS